jgi:hypothetical protein
MHELYFEAAICEEVRKLVEARPGARNSVLNSAAYSLATLGIPEETIRNELTRAAEQCGLIKDDGRKAAEATIVSGMKAGYANRRQTHYWVNGVGSYRPQRSPSPPNRPARETAKPQVSASEPTPSQFSGRRIQIPPRTTFDKDGKPKFIIAGDDGPPCWENEIRRHVYRRDGFPARPCLCHRRHLRCHRCFHNSAAADRVGNRSCDGVPAFLGAGPAVVAAAGTSSGGHSGLGCTSILAAGGWGDCCLWHSSTEV